MTRKELHHKLLQNEVRCHVGEYCIIIYYKPDPYWSGLFRYDTCTVFTPKEVKAMDDEKFKLFLTEYKLHSLFS